MNIFAKQDRFVLKSKFFGQKPANSKKNHCILTVGQKLGMILVIKWFKNGSYQNIILAKNVFLNYIVFFIEKNQKDVNDTLRRKFTLKIIQMLTLFDN